MLMGFSIAAPRTTNYVRTAYFYFAVKPLERNLGHVSELERRGDYSRSRSFACV